jgi:hypothetical protein
MLLPTGRRTRHAGSDYVAIPTTAGSIAAGGTSTTISVTVNGDTTAEFNEIFFLNITDVNMHADRVTGTGRLPTTTPSRLPSIRFQGAAATPRPRRTTRRANHRIVTLLRTGANTGTGAQADSHSNARC